MTTDELKVAVAKYHWSQKIHLTEDVYTPPEPAFCDGRAQELVEMLTAEEISGKSVIDLGCRDGLHSFRAEKLGASRVVAVDNDLSRGAVGLLVPYFNSKVEFVQENLYNLKYRNEFDVVLAFGLLYHLRFPFTGLYVMANLLKVGGLLIIETAIDNRDEDRPLLYCPTKDSPYEPSSCSFFNKSGLITSAESFGLSLVEEHQMAYANPRPISRNVFRFRRTGAVDDYTWPYWINIHDLHTVQAYLQHNPKVSP